MASYMEQMKVPTVGEKSFIGRDPAKIAMSTQLDKQALDILKGSEELPACKEQMA